MEFLEGYVSGELPADALRRFEGHLARCPVCTAYTDTFKATIRIANHLHDCDVADANVPEELVTAILAARAAKTW